jgi:hypothetical protein
MHAHCRIHFVHAPAPSLFGLCIDFAKLRFPSAISRAFVSTKPERFHRQSR